MDTRDFEIAKNHMDEILEYRTVLAHILKRKVTINQAITDWIEKDYINKIPWKIENSTHTSLQQITLVLQRFFHRCRKYWDHNFMMTGNLASLSSC